MVATGDTCSVSVLQSRFSVYAAERTGVVQAAAATGGAQRRQSRAKPSEERRGEEKAARFLLIDTAKHPSHECTHTCLSTLRPTAVVRRVDRPLPSIACCCSRQPLEGDESAACHHRPLEKADSTNREKRGGIHHSLPPNTILSSLLSLLAAAAEPWAAAPARPATAAAAAVAVEGMLLVRALLLVQLQSTALTMAEQSVAVEATIK